MEFLFQTFNINQMVMEVHNKQMGHAQGLNNKNEMGENLICKRKNIAFIRHNYIIKYLALFAGIHFLFILHNKTTGT